MIPDSTRQLKQSVLGHLSVGKVKTSEGQPWQADQTRSICGYFPKSYWIPVSRQKWMFRMKSMCTGEIKLVEDTSETTVAAKWQVGRHGCQVDAPHWCNDGDAIHSDDAMHCTLLMAMNTRRKTSRDFELVVTERLIRRAGWVGHWRHTAVPVVVISSH